MYIKKKKNNYTYDVTHNGKIKINEIDVGSKRIYTVCSNYVYNP